MGVHRFTNSSVPFSYGHSSDGSRDVHAVDLDLCLGSITLISGSTVSVYLLFESTGPDPLALSTTSSSRFRDRSNGLTLVPQVHPDGTTGRGPGPPLPTGTRVDTSGSPWYTSNTQTTQGRGPTSHSSLGLQSRVSDEWETGPGPG